MRQGGWEVRQRIEGGDMSERAMSRRMKLIIPAAFISCIGIVVLTANLGHAEPVSESASKSCLSAPGSSGPEGSHWYYRVDRANNRRCWYLGVRGERVRQAVNPASQTSAPSQAVASSPPSQRILTSQDDRPVAPRADSIDNRRGVAAAAGQAESFTIPNGIVTSFSKVWPSLPQTSLPQSSHPPTSLPQSKLPQAGSTMGLHLSTIRNGNAAGPSAADQGPDELVSMPLIRLDDSGTVGANVRASTTSADTAQQIMPWLIVVLGLAGVLVGLIYRLAAPRRRSGPAHRAGEIGAARPKPDLFWGTGPRPAKTIGDGSDATSAAAFYTSAAGRWVESARAAFERDQSRWEVEAGLREIADRRKRSAA
jgi:hypothetical protein